MNTTITYKGTTLTTLNPSQTKTLNTAGKYMEDNVTIVDNTIDGNNLEYGLTDGSLPLSGVAKSDLAELEE
jgi:hypothetical protein